MHMIINIGDYPNSQQSEHFFLVPSSLNSTLYALGKKHFQVLVANALLLCSRVLLIFFHIAYISLTIVSIIATLGGSGEGLWPKSSASSWLQLLACSNTLVKPSVGITRFGNTQFVDWFHCLWDTWHTCTCIGFFGLMSLYHVRVELSLINLFW